MPFGYKQPDRYHPLLRLEFVDMATGRLLARSGTYFATVVGASGLTASTANRYLHRSTVMASPKDEEWKKATSVYDFTVKDIDNQDVKLDKYKGKVMLIVNVASKCGFTKGNYKELNELYSKYKDQGLSIVGFPCNQFGHQEPGCDVDIKEFMKKNNVEWDMFAKIDVNGDNAIPLYNWLKTKAPGTLFDAIKWNFTKFLINKEGIPVARYAPNKSPLEFEKDIKEELQK